MPFVTELTVREEGVHLWEVAQPLIYQGNRDELEVPQGFFTDFASIPKALRWLIPKYGKYNKCAVLHDFLCVEARAGRFSRRDADGLFRRTLKEVGVRWSRRWVMWIGVRWGGRLSDSTLRDLAIIVPGSLLVGGGIGYGTYSAARGVVEGVVRLVGIVG